LLQRLAVVEVLLVKDVFNFFVELRVLGIGLELGAEGFKGLIGVGTLDEKVFAFTASG
jgi:hypothetical protein